MTCPFVDRLDWSHFEVRKKGAKAECAMAPFLTSQNSGAVNRIDVIRGSHDSPFKRNGGASPPTGV